MSKLKKEKDWLVALFKKENFDENLERHPLRTFKKTYGNVVVVAFHGLQKELPRLCIELQLSG